MKKEKIKIYFIILLMMLFIPHVNAEKMELTPEQKALQSTADALYNRGVYAQYFIPGLSYLMRPEDATSQHTLYSYCSHFVYSVYSQALGMHIPEYTDKMIVYGKYFYKNSKYPDAANTVIEYYEYDKNSGKISDNKGALRTDITPSNIDSYANTILTKYKLQVGDILVAQNGNAGHTVIVYDIEYNDAGEPTDAILREAGSEYEHDTTKLSDGISYDEDGTFRELYLKKESSKGRPGFLSKFKSFKYFSILRPIITKADGTKKYIDVTFYRPNGKSGVEELEIYKPEEAGNVKELDVNITDTATQRMKYDKIYIEKTVDIFNNTVVQLGDTLTYTIKTINKGKTTYGAFDIIEEIPSSVEVVDKGGGELNNNKLTWHVTSLGVSGEKIVTYKVRVKNDIKNLGKEIVSYGTVAGIPSSNKTYIENDTDNTNNLKNTIATRKNLISKNLNEDEKRILLKQIKKLLESGKYIRTDFINNVYLEAFGINLNLKHKKDSGDNAQFLPYYVAGMSGDTEIRLFDKYGSESYTTSLIIENDKTGIERHSDKTNTGVYLNETNPYSGMVLTGYYNSLYPSVSAEGKITKYSIRKYEYSFLNKYKTFENDFGRDERADTIYKENFNTGDILIYQNYLTNYTGEYGNCAYCSTGMYYLIYVKEEDKFTATVNGKSQVISGFIGLGGSSGNVNLLKLGVDDESLRSLFGKDHYVIFRPSLEKNVSKQEVSVEYSTLADTKDSVIVTITGNEKLAELDGWKLSSDSKYLTKVFNSNATESYNVSDINGHTQTVSVSVQNIISD